MGKGREVVHRGTERAFLGLGTDGMESVRDHGHEDVDQPEVEYDDTYDEEYARNEKLGVDHSIHRRRPLQK